MMHVSYSCDVRSVVLQYFNNKFVNDITDIYVYNKRTSTKKTKLISMV
jgi:hypothetical protein